ncbi:prorelaxin H1 [Nematolebias whitei]|uniref:prorelaxin H1 n=1 Tax=Nematolebias whitei TaxID=451745 RepID=UPI00189911F7|nr:prorelaxin H1 [Nematolebias whitei]
MLWRVALAVVCIGGACSRVRADVLGRMILPRDYGVKLCGREFIRAVIFTCGGSRWKRSTEGDADPFQWTSLSDLTVEDNQQTWQRDAEPTDTRSPLPVASSLSLADLLSLYRTAGGRQQPPSRVSDPSGGSAVLGEQDAASIWSVSSRKKRNFSLGVAGMCCSQGCTKNDIGRLC